MTEEVAVYVYVIAASEHGPSKVGWGGDPKRRLASLQTGNPASLRVFHSERTGYISAYAEKEVHRILAPTRMAVGGKEWFAVTPDEAKIVVQGVAFAFRLAGDRTKTMRELSWGSAHNWLKLKESYREYCDENDIEPSCLLETVEQVCALKILAQEVTPEASIGLPFADFLHSYDDGILLDWAFEQQSEPTPKDDKLTPYIRAHTLLEKRGMNSWNGYYQFRNPAIRWLEWISARKLTSREVRFLIKLWNAFVEEHNATAAKGLRRQSHLQDGVYLRILETERDGQPLLKLLFSSNDFRAVVCLPPGVRLSEHDCPGWCYAVIDEKLVRLGDLDVQGFVSATMSSDAQMSLLLQWLDSAGPNRDNKFAEFLSDPSSFFPAPYKWDGCEQAFLKVTAMPRIGVDGELR